MTELLLFGLAAILIFGVLAQWTAWHLRLPSILLLLLCGILAGPVLGVIQPDVLFGNLLEPLVSLSVAVILYEGGLSLQLSELRNVGGVVYRLITIGMLVTWMLAAWAAYLLLGFSPTLAVLFGAILVVTGPTVIVPLLRQVRPSGQVGSVLKWEGILIDPIGAMLTVLVFEITSARGAGEAAGLVVTNVLKMVGMGVGIGVAGALLMLFLLRRYLVPDFLQNPLSLMLVVAVYTAAQLLQKECGLLAVTVMGIVLANQRRVPVRHIVEFKENLRVLLISSLFILLAARMAPSDLRVIDGRSLLFVAVLFLVARPLAVAISTRGSALSWRERVFLAWMAPRGIVAAAVSSVFALRLVEQGYAEAERLVPLTFLVITITVAVYGLSASPVARWLGVASPSPQGVLLVGAHHWARSMARALQQAGVKALLVDTSPLNIAAAQREGLTAQYANILSDHVMTEVDLSGIGRLLALTSNDEVNILAAQRFAHVFGRAEVYHLAPHTRGDSEQTDISPELRGRVLFGPEHTYQQLGTLFAGNAAISQVALGDGAPPEPRTGNGIIPLFVLTDTGRVNVITAESRLAPKPGHTLIGIDQPESDLA